VSSNRLKDLGWPLVSALALLLVVALVVLGIVLFLSHMFEVIGR
jgi:Tfp pilus assembly protein PilX